MPLKILHLADIHLGHSQSYLKEKATVRKNEIRDRFFEILQYAGDARNGIQAVLIAGDLFDHHTPEASLVERVIAGLKRLNEQGIPTVTLPGTHDEISYPKSVFQVYKDRWPGILVTNPEPSYIATLTLNDTPCHIYGMAFTAGLSHPPFDLINTVDTPGKHIALFHGTLDPPDLFNPTDRDVALSSKHLLESGMDYVALGHFHLHRAMSGDGCLIVYSGGVEGKGFDDPGVGFLTVVDILSNPPTIEKIPFSCRRIITREFDLTHISGNDEIERKIREMSDQDLILRVKLTGIAQFIPDIGRLCASLSPYFYYIALEENFYVFDNQRVSLLKDERTIQGLLIQKLLSYLSQAKSDRDKWIVDLAIRKGLMVFDQEIHD